MRNEAATGLNATVACVGCAITFKALRRLEEQGNFIMK
jgi:hypothetical protein